MSNTVQYHQPSDATLVVTEAAIKHFQKKIHEHEHATGVRFGTKKAGCSGLKYVIDFVEAPDENDLSFEVAPAFTVYVPRLSYPYLKGCVIDYVKEGLNGTVRIKNPNESGSCGCGESFSVDVEASSS